MSRDLKKIDRKTAKKITERVTTFLSGYPDWRGKEVQCGLKGIYRYRHLGYQILYVIGDEEGVIKILQVKKDQAPAS